MRDRFTSTGELADKGFEENLPSHYETTRHKLKSELAEVERTMSTALALATPQETEVHEEQQRTTSRKVTSD